MLLSAGLIEREVGAGRVSLSPFVPGRLKSASYVVTLGGRFRRWLKRDQPIRPWSPGAGNAHLDEPLDARSIVLLPGDFMLGCTEEQIALPADLFGVISPLSHIARFGLVVNCGADFINPGFGSGEPTAITLELANLNSSPIELTSGMPIGHLRIGRVAGQVAASTLARSIYEGADPVIGPQLFEEWDDLSDVSAAPGRLSHP